MVPDLKEIERGWGKEGESEEKETERETGRECEEREREGVGERRGREKDI